MAQNPLRIVGFEPIEEPTPTSAPPATLSIVGFEPLETDTLPSDAPTGPTAADPAGRALSATGVDEPAFQRWYAGHAQRLGLSPDPDGQSYDYRAAFQAGAQPGPDGHWPSQFKQPGHPNEVVGGFNTRTGQRVPGTPRASEQELIASGWEPATAKRLAQMPEPTDRRMPLASMLVPGRQHTVHGASADLFDRNINAANLQPRDTMRDLVGRAVGEKPRTDYYTEVTAKAPPPRTKTQIAAEAPERTIRSLAKGYEEGFEAGTWNAIAGVAENLGFSTIAAYYNAAADEAKALGAKVAPSTEGLSFTEQAVYSGVESIGGSAPSLAVGAFLGPGASLALMGATTGGNAYREARRQGLEPGRAAIYGTIDGVIEMATERIPATKLFGDVLAGKGVLKVVLNQLKEEIPNEQFATLGQDFNAWASLPENKDKPFRAFVAERPSAAAQTFIATLVATVGQSGGAVAAERLLTKRTSGDVVREGVGGAAAKEVVAEQVAKATEAPAEPPAPPAAAPVAEPTAPTMRDMVSAEPAPAPVPAPAAQPQSIQARAEALLDAQPDITAEELQEALRLGTFGAARNLLLATKARRAEAVAPAETAPADVASPVDMRPVASDASGTMRDLVAPPEAGAGIAPEQAAQLTALGHDPATMTVVDAQEILRAGAPPPAPPTSDAQSPDAMSIEALRANERAHDNDPDLRRRRAEMIAQADKAKGEKQARPRGGEADALAAEFEAMRAANEGRNNRELDSALQSAVLGYDTSTAVEQIMWSLENGREDIAQAILEKIERDAAKSEANAGKSGLPEGHPKRQASIDATIEAARQAAQLASSARATFENVKKRIAAAPNTEGVPSGNTPQVVEADNDAAIEARTVERVAADPDGFVDRYIEKFGTVLNADNASELFPEYAESPETRATRVKPVRKAASAIAERAFTRLLAAPVPPGKDRLVVFTSGGNASGKSSTTNMQGRQALTWDTTASQVGPTAARIDEALAAGFDVEINHASLDPAQALIRAIMRAEGESQGRTVTVNGLASTHQGARDTLLALADRYRDDPRVNIAVFDNNGTELVARDLDWLRQQEYPTGDDLRASLHELLDGALDEGAISPAVYRGFGGRRSAAPSEPIVRSSDSGRPAGPPRSDGRTATEAPVDTDDTRGTAGSRADADAPGDPRRDGVADRPQASSLGDADVAKHIEAVFAEVYKDARRQNPALKRAALRAEFDKRFAFLRDLIDEQRALAEEHDPRQLLREIVRMGGIFENEGGQFGEMRRMREGQAFGMVAGVPGVLVTKPRKLVPVKKRIDGKVEIRMERRGGLPLDVVLQSLQEDGRFPGLESVEDLVSAIEELQRNGAPDDPADILPGTARLAAVGIEPGTDWWTRPLFPEEAAPTAEDRIVDEAAEDLSRSSKKRGAKAVRKGTAKKSQKPRPFTAENLADVFGIPLEQALMTYAMAENMGLPMEKIELVQGPPEDAAPDRLEQNPTRLSVLHNLSAGNLLWAAKHGGIPVPSLAVVHDDMGLAGFGEITLIGDRKLADPDEGVPVFDADAYSARAPRPEYAKVRSSLAQKAVDAFRPFAERFDDHRTKDALWDNAVNTPKPDDTIHQMTNRSLAAKAWFLSEQGLPPVAPVMRPMRLERGWASDPEMVRQYRPLMRAIDSRDPGSRMEVNEDTIALRDLVRGAVTRYAEANGYDALDLSMLASRWGDKGEWMTDDSAIIPFGVMHSIERDVERAGKKELDETATGKRFTKALKGREDEFARWVQAKVWALYGPPTVKVDGRAMPYTVENIAEAMKSARVKGVEQGMTFGEGKARATAAKRLTSLQHMRNAAGAPWGIGRPEEAREAAQAALSAWRDEIIKAYKWPNATWDALDGSMKALARWAKGARTTANLRRALAQEDFRADRIHESDLEDGVAAGKLWMEAPVPYFEAKPQRVVALGEFAGAVIPKKASAEVREALTAAGLPFVEYNAAKGADANREKAVVKFRRQLAEQGRETLFQRGGLFDDDADINEFGEAQTRLPGDVGAVRNEERPTPKLSDIEDEFRLTPQYDKRRAKQNVLFQSGDAQAILPPGFWYFDNILSALPQWQAKGTPEQLLAHLKKIKGAMDEAADIGLSDWLQGKRSVTRDEVRAFVEAHKIEIKEVELSERGQDDIDESRDRVREILRTREYIGFDNFGQATRYLREDAGQLERFLADEKLDAEDAAAVRAYISKTKSYGGAPKYSQYVLGGPHSGYREILLTLPKRPVDSEAMRLAAQKLQAAELAERELTAAGGDILSRGDLTDATDAARAARDVLRNRRDATYQSSHFDQPNVLVHLRVNTRTLADGRRVLFAEEMQSDWHQAGRKKGYRPEKEAKLAELVAKRAALSAEMRGLDNSSQEYIDKWEARSDIQAAIDTLGKDDPGVPDAPFKGDGWKKLALKRLLAMAAEEGVDGLAWTTGAQQAERYDLSKQIDEIRYSKNEDGTFKFAAMKAGQAVIREENATASRVADVVGKEIAEKMEAGDGQFRSRNGNVAPHMALEGVDLKVGGEGMKGFYDRELVNLANDLAKKHGQRVEKGQIKATFKSRYIINNGERPNGDPMWEVLDAEDDGNQIGVFDAEDEAVAFQEKLNGDAGNAPVHVLPTPSAMRETLRRWGQALFQGRPRTRWQDAKASIEFTGLPWLADAKATIRALTKPDVSSPIHELAHVARRFLLNRDMPAEKRRGVTDEDITTIEQWAGAKDGQWDTPAEEKFARGFERYVREGGPTLPSSVREIFAKLAAWMTDVYQSIQGSAIDVEITPEVRAVFDRLVTRKERLAAEAVAKTEAAAPAKPSGPPRRTSDLVEAPPSGRMNNRDVLADAAQSLKAGAALSPEDAEILRDLAADEADANAGAIDVTPPKKSGPPRRAAAVEPWQQTSAQFRAAEMGPYVEGIKAAIRAGKNIAVRTSLRIVPIRMADQILVTASGVVKAPSGRTLVTLTDDQVFDLARQAGMEPPSPADRQYHRDLVLEAAKAGKAIPDEVRAEYAKDLADFAQTGYTPRQPKPGQTFNVFRVNARGRTQYAGGVDFTGADWVDAKDKAALTPAQVYEILDLAANEDDIRIVDAEDVFDSYTASDVRGYTGQDANDDATWDASLAWNAPKVDKTAAGDQTRLPGDVGSVRDEERAQPTEDVPEQTLRLSGQDAYDQPGLGLDPIARVEQKAKQRLKDRGTTETLFQDGDQRTLPADDRDDLLVIAAAKVARGRDRAAFDREMAREFGAGLPLAALFREGQKRAAVLADLDIEEYFNFRRLEVSETEKDHLRGAITETVLRTGRVPKERESWEAIRAEAREMAPEVVEQLAPFQQMQAPFRAVRLIARERIATLNQEIYEGRLALEGIPGDAPEAIQRERVLAEKENDLRGLLDVWMRQRSEDGRNLAMHRMMVNNLENWYDQTFWASKARRELGLPVGTQLPVDVWRVLQDILNRGRRAVENGQPVAPIQLELSRYLTRLQKSTWLEVISAVRKAGLLTGPKTHARNVLGNLAFASLEELSRVPAVVVDFVVGTLTGHRTVHGVSARAVAHASREAATKGLEEARDILRSGSTASSLMQVDARRELNSGIKWLDSYVNTVFRAMGATDRLFKSYAFRRSLEEQAALEAINRGVSPIELLAKPTAEMLARAVADAEFATFNNPNLLAGGVSDMKAGLKRKGQAGKVAAFAIDMTVPFVNTPSNILARMLDYTPGGVAWAGTRAAWAIGKEVVIGKVYARPTPAAIHAAVARAMTTEQQRLFAQGIGRGATGSALIYLGYMLAAAGMASGMGGDDEGDRNVKEAAGVLPGAVKINGRWHQIATFSPAGNLVSLGASIYRSATMPLKDELMRSTKLMAVAARLALDQPMLKGMSDLIASLQRPGAKAEAFAAGMAGSFVPTFVNDLASVFDPYRRDTRPEGGFRHSLWTGVAARLPGARNLLPARLNVLGEEQAQTARAIWDPTIATVARDLQDDVLRELIKHDVGITWPRQRQATARRAAETAEEYRQRIVDTGAEIKARVGRLVASPGYRERSDEKQAEMIGEAIDEARRRVTARQKQLGGPPMRPRFQ